MSDEENKLIMDPYRQIRIGKVKDITKLTQAEIDAFVETVSRAYRAKKPLKEDLLAVQKFLKNYPEMCKAVFALVESTQGLMIKNIMGGVEVAQIGLEEYLVT